MNTFLISDTHFFHNNIITFKREDGTPLRDFPSLKHMMEFMVEKWNSVVKPGDKVYHLGDTAFKSSSSLRVFADLNGDKVLIKGNHDIFKLEDYTQHFRDIRGYHVMNGMILSHIPVHESNLYRFGTNIHGHLHANRVKMKVRYPHKETEIIDPRYFNVSVEQIDFTPILFEQAIIKIKEQGGTIGCRDGNGPDM